MNKGSSFEDKFDWYASTHRCVSIPQYVETGFNSKGQVFLKGRAWPDRVCGMDGLMFICDLKSTEKCCILDVSLGFKGKAGLQKQLQFDKLVQCWEAGIVAFYLVEWTQYESVEMFLVDGRAEWPFICEYGKGISVGTSTDDESWFATMVNEVHKLYGER